MNSEGVASIITNDNYVTKQVTIRDYYPEKIDGIKKFVFAAYIQKGYKSNQPITEIPDAVTQSLEPAIHAGFDKHNDMWDVYAPPLIVVKDKNANFDDLYNFFIKLDNMTDGDDRIILVLVGHGTYYNGSYCFELGNGDLVPASDLVALMKILGPALDFVWFLSCYSWQFQSDPIINNLNSTVYDYILWTHKGQLYFTIGANATRVVANAIKNEDITVVGPLEKFNGRLTLWGKITNVDGNWRQAHFLLSTDKMFLYVPFPPHEEDVVLPSFPGIIFMPAPSPSIVSPPGTIIMPY